GSRTSAKRTRSTNRFSRSPPTRSTPRCPRPSPEPSRLTWPKRTRPSRSARPWLASAPVLRLNQHPRPGRPRQLKRPPRRRPRSRRHPPRRLRSRKRPSRSPHRSLTRRCPLSRLRRPRPERLSKQRLLRHPPLRPWARTPRMSPRSCAVWPARRASTSRRCPVPAPAAATAAGERAGAAKAPVKVASAEEAAKLRGATEEASSDSQTIAKRVREFPDVGAKLPQDTEVDMPREVKLRKADKAVFQAK